MKVKWSIPDIGEEEAEAVKEAVKEGWASGFGPRVKEFADKFRKKVGARYAIPVCNGTCGLLASFLALDAVSRRDRNRQLRFAVPTWTYAATAATADLVGKIKLFDVFPPTFNMNTDESFGDVDVAVPVDVGGLPVRYDDVRDRARIVVADSCESLGATYKGSPIGSIALVHVFSFFASKVMTTGEGGMITTKSYILDEIIRKIINQGYEGDPWNYMHVIRGFNFRMTEMQAAIGLVQLRKLDKYVQHRRDIAQLYRDEIGDLVEYQFEPKDRKSSYYLFTILVEPKIRDGLRIYLQKKGIETRLWRPIHKQPAYQHLNVNRRFISANYLYRWHLHLPIHNRMTDAEALLVSKTIKKYIGANK